LDETKSEVNFSGGSGFAQKGKKLQFILFICSPIRLFYFYCSQLHIIQAPGNKKLIATMIFMIQDVVIDKGHKM
jgi:hypothetical protein